MTFTRKGYFMMRVIYFFAFVFFVFSFSLYAEVRTWTASGYNLDAELVRFDESSNNVVTLRDKEGKTFEVKFDRLSKEDQEYIQNYVKSRGGDNPFVLRSDQETTGKERVRHALLVGVNDYKVHSDENNAKIFEPLRFACNDVVNLAEQLQKAGYKQENVTVVCDEAGKTSLSPVNEHIERELNQLV
jgi:hypothetical protein